MKCALCGFEFTESEAKRPCARCPLGAHCDLRLLSQLWLSSPARAQMAPALARAVATPQRRF
jgi:DNA-directed RNA polymerase subunit RPC12/RpoP